MQMHILHLVQMSPTDKAVIILTDNHIFIMRWTQNNNQTMLKN